MIILLNVYPTDDYTITWNDLNHSILIKTGKVSDAPSQAWLRNLCHYAENYAKNAGLDAAKTYINTHFQNPDMVFLPYSKKA